MIKYICAKDEYEAGSCAARIFAEIINSKSDAVIGLATGSTPLKMYAKLVEMCKNSEISFKNVISVNLDEYIGLQPSHDQSYAYFMRENLFKHIDINPDNTFIPNGVSQDDLSECDRYNNVLEKIGGVDVQLLGIGHNGHIAFNEPNSFFTKDTSIVDLSESTINANSRFFISKNDVPRRAISMGIGRILRSKRILLLATGESKAKILEESLFGRITPQIPASILQFYQGEMIVVGDKAAFSEIIKNHPEVL